MAQMTLQQFGDQVKTKFPAYKNMDSVDLANKVINKYPQYKEWVSNPAPATGNSFLSMIANALPTVFGTAGQIGGGALLGTGGAVAGAAVPGADLTGASEVGGGILGERLGQTGGGAIGQGFGQWLQNLMEGKNQGNNVLKSGIQGGIYANVPFANKLDKIPGFKGILGKLVTRGIGGYAAGASSQGVSDFNPNKPNYGESLSSLNKGGMTGAVANEVIPGGMDILGKAGNATVGKAINNARNYLGNTIPEHINQAVKDQQDKMAADLVGAKNVDTARTEDIIPNSMDKINISDIKNYLDKANNSSNNIENELQNVLKSTSGKTISYKNLRDKLQGIFDQAPMDEIMQIVRPQGNDLQANDIITNILKHGSPKNKQAITDFLKNSNEASSFLSKFMPRYDEKGNALSGNVDENTPLTASQVNIIKRNIAKRYGKTQLHKDLYSTLKSTVEDLSGNSDKIKALNQRAHTVSEIKNLLQHQYDRSSSLPNEYTMGSDINLYKSPELQGLTSGANAALMTGALKAGGWPMMLIAHLMSPTIDKKIITPENAQLLKKIMGSSGKKSASNIKQNKATQEIQTLLHQLGIRGYMGSNQ